MKTFEEIYSESRTTAALTLGYGSLAGRLIVSSHGEDSQGGLMAWGSLSYDGDSGALMIGDVQMGLPGKVIVGSLGGGDGSAVIDAAASRLTLGGHGNGTVKLKNRSDKETVSIEGEHGKLVLGGEGEDGDLSIRTAGNETSIALGGSDAKFTLGGAGTNGDVVVRNENDHATVTIDGGMAVLTVGGRGANGDIVVRDDSEVETIKITGHDGDITFLNADVAEDFDVDESVLSEAVPGTVMTIGEDGRLTPCEDAYDPRVVGVVAGAGDYRPGIVLDRSGGRHRRPLTMVGKAYCRVDAEAEPVAVGDLLTTSPRRGHAMKATDRERAFGAVIGKALSSCAGGAGLIPVLVALQ